MCRNITELRGLEPPATDDEVSAAARQYIRKVTGIRDPNAQILATYESAIDAVTQATAELLRQLPPRRQPPRSVPPLRQPQVRERLGLPPIQG